MPDLNSKIYGPGTFIDKKKEYLYSLDGHSVDDKYVIERLNLSS